MSHDSLRRNQEYMGYGALSGLFRESQAQPPHTYQRDLNRLRQWQQANAERDTIQHEMFKYLSTALHALQHVFIYKLTPKFNFLKSKCKSITNHMDTASLCVIIFALFTLSIIFLSRFIVDYEDINNLSPIDSNIASNIDIMSNQNKSTGNINSRPPLNDIVVEEFDTIDNLFQPTPVPLIADNENTNDDNNDIVNDTMFNEWVLVQSVDWNDIKTGQVIKIKETKNNQFATATIQNIDLSQMNIAIQLTNCWIFCHQTIDIITSNRMIYLIENQHKSNDVKDDSRSHSDATANNDNDDKNGENEIYFDPTQLYESMNGLKDDQNEFKYWVQSQFTEIQSNNDELKEVLTDYLDEKMNKLLQILENQQYSIQSIMHSHEQQKNANNINNSIDNAAKIDWDWDSIENRIDDKIESVVKVQLEEKFGNLAQEIGQEIAKEIAQNSNDNVPIGENSDDILKGGSEGSEDRKNKQQKIDWTYRVVSHSKLKQNKEDIFHEYGYWIMHNLFAKWNQQSISTTYKPGDCTPLELDKNYNKPSQSHSYITIELYRAIYVKQISLFHYHSVVLTQTAINAAPKNFQIWGSFNLTKWYDLGNFSYNYYEREDTQYFDVFDMANDRKKVVIDTSLDGNGNGQILNDTSMVTNDVYEDYMMGFKFIAFRLLSNYGGSDYGCIYRLRVFGDIVS